WRAWLFVFFCVAIEFSFVYWAGLLLQARLGIEPAVATTLASAFVLGMLAGRSALGGGLISAFSVPALLRASIGLVVVGWLTSWVAGAPLMAGAGLLVAG